PLPYSVSSFRGARFASEPGIHNHRPSFKARRPMHLAKQNLPVVMDSGLSPSGCPGMTTSTEPPSPPFHQLRRNLLPPFLLRPLAGAPPQIFSAVGHELLHAVGSRRRQPGIVFGHDHQRRHAHGVVEPG